jgi:tRNA-guanine family transglycosylase
VETPVLFPVVNLMTGTTTRGGGIWKYVLRDLFRRHSPMMTQALQFLDFDLTGPQLQRWITNPLGTVLDIYLRYYREELGHLGISDYRGPLFLDSGGYKFLGNRRLDLTKHGIAGGADAWKGIQAIQDGIGGDIHVSLDYPLKPGLVDDEAAELIELSLANALSVLEHLTGASEPRKAFFAPCHGRTYEEMRAGVSRLFTRVQAAGLGTHSLGIAIGSLVPLRTIKKYEAMIGIINGARDGIPDGLRHNVPLHVFGVTGTMIPVLAYLGVDTFDSSSYVQHARILEYYHPDKRARLAFLELEAKELPCDCPHCRRWSSYEEMHSIMVGSSKSDVPRSEVYAALALHNLHWDNKLVNETREAIRCGSLVEYLVDHAREFLPIRPAVEFLARTSPNLNVLLSRQYFTMGLRQRFGSELELPDGPIDLTAYAPGPPPWESEAQAILPAPYDPGRRVSLKYTPDSFVVPQYWKPAPYKDVLLVLPCSEVKPYAASRSHQTVMTHLVDRLASVGRIQKVTLSGLYGPVPSEFEEAEEIMCYDFRLAPSDEAQIQLCALRLTEFLRKHGSQFAMMVGYVTSRAYRDVMQRVAAQVPGFRVLPGSLVKQQMTELYRREHLAALATLIESEVQTLDSHSTCPVTA